MPKTYVNTGFVPGNSAYADVSNTLHTPTLSFIAKSSSVKVSTATQKMVGATLTYVAPFGLKSCTDGDCEVGQLNASAKITLNFPYGDTVSLDGLVAELNRTLVIWKANNLAFGVVPPVTVDLDVT